MAHRVETIRAAGRTPARRAAALAVSAALILGTAGACGDDDSGTATTSGADASTTTTPSPSTTTPAELEGYIGLTVEEAGALADEEGRPWRVVEEDGEPLPATMDLIENRVNLVVQDGTVVGASLG
ncbi:MAG: hypothetical protein IPM45_11100 [Acidimicrobiales bacterium]|nr:hypothetical protein [Acidimicrobiales bacterium]